MRAPRFFRDRSFDHPGAIALKSGFACLLALSLNRLTGNQDDVSTSFIAVMCVSPTVIMGLRRAAAQLVGSLVGAGFGAAMLAAAVDPVVGVPVAVALAVGLTSALGLPGGYPVAAFSALFVQLVPFGDATDTLVVRLLSVGLAAACGFVVNALVSSLFYTRIFRRRVGLLEARVWTLLHEAQAHGPWSVQPGFLAVSEVEQHLQLAIEELGWRRQPKARDDARALLERVLRLRRVLHLVYGLGYTAEEAGLRPDAAAAWLAWVGKRSTADAGPRPELAAELEPAAQAVEATLRRLEQRA